MKQSLQRSDALHGRVQAFIRACSHGAETPESFDALACSIARFQAEAGNGLERLLSARGAEACELRDASQIPAIPTDAFKLRRIACHAPELDAIVFRTSGTTVGARGEHPMRTTETYEAAARAWGTKMLVPDGKRLRVIALAQQNTADSSLGFMLGAFGRDFGMDCIWAIEHEVLQLDRIRAACEDAAASQGAVLVAGASFAFVHLLDALGGKRIELPPASRVMQTGGFKGRSREVDGAWLQQSIAAAFGLEPGMICSEYGMTELSSQAYEGTLRKALRAGDPQGPAGVYFAPPWMRVEPVDPESLAPAETGIARVIDLANIDSAVAVQTADLVRRAGKGFELLGRAPGALPRGCSIGIDELLGAG